jgi:hypothetical protein
MLLLFQLWVTTLLVRQKEPRIAVRIPQTLRERLDEVQKLTGLDEPSIIRNAVDAFCNYVEQFKESPPFPLEFRKPGTKGDEVSPSPTPKKRVAA